MKIIMMRPSYRPELSGGTHLAIDLVEDFIKEGYEIEVITPISQKFLKEVDETTDECKVHRISSCYNKKDVFSRIMRYIDISWKMYKTAKGIDADLIMTHSMPPLLGPLGTILSRKKKIPVLYWEQDIVSQSLISTGIFGKTGIKQRIIFKIAEILEKISERRSSHIITISEQFKRMHMARGIVDKKISVIYNWIDTKQIYHVNKEDNILFKELNLPKDKFIVSYCGNLGIPQNVEIMVDAAELLQEYQNIFFVIIGGGSREEYIKKYVEDKRLNNISLTPLQPLERSHYVYSIGDVGLVIGRAGTSKNGFPSKTWSIMSAEQAIIACFDLDSELCEFVRKGNCGKTIEPDSSKKLANAILYLYNHREETKKMGYNARKYVENEFARKQATYKIIHLAKELVNGGRKK